jgi:hypothetical protein
MYCSPADHAPRICTAAEADTVRMLDVLRDGGMAMVRSNGSATSRPGVGTSRSTASRCRSKRYSTGQEFCLSELLPIAAIISDPACMHIHLSVPSRTAISGQSYGTVMSSASAGLVMV